MEPELIADFACRTGEGPLWHAEENCLYWVDIPDGEIYRYFPDTGQSELVYAADRQIGGFTIQEDGRLLLFMEGCRIALLDGDGLSILTDSIPGMESNRFNDVIAGPQGQVFCGTMSTPDQPDADGLLYRLDRDGSLTEILQGVGTSNGMGFTPDRSHFYHTDTRTGTVTRFPWTDAAGDFDRRAGTPWYVETGDTGGGRPDGMTVDARGHLWVAHWDGSRLVHLDERGVLLESVEFPVLKVSSAVFGGRNLEDLYVTTAGGHERNSNGETAGALYRLRGLAQGLPEFRSAIRCD